MGVECGAILSQRGTVAPQKLLTAFLEEDYRDIPPVLAQAMVSAAAILARTTNPQAADFELDRAYFAQMLALSDGLSDGGFARGYVQLQIDSANLRAAVRTRRMAKDADFLRPRSSRAARSARTACSRRSTRPRRSPRSTATRAGQCSGCRRAA